MTTLTPDELQEEQELAAMLETLGESPDGEFSTAGGVLPKGEGLMQDVSDPTRLVPVYRTITGEREMVPAWTLAGKNSILRYREPDGSRRFSVQPTKKFVGGKVPCMLHESHPDRQRFRDMGIVRVGAAENCAAGKLGSLASQRTHMIRRHRQEWEMIQAAIAEEREEEQRLFMRLQIEQAQGRKAGNGRTSA